MPTALCLGETMAVLSPPPGIPLSMTEELVVGIGGAESNVAMGLAAMGIDCHWVSRVGRDGFGRRILAELQQHDVGVTGVTVDPVRPTGLYIKVPATSAEKEGPDVGPSVLYYREGSAASAMSPALLEEPRVVTLLSEASLVHLSGITPALSDDCAALTRSILTAPRNGRLVSFDVNWRPALWRRRDPRILRELANLADVVLVGLDEAQAALGTDDEAELRRLLPDPAVLVVKDADLRATAWLQNGERVDVSALSVDVLEPVGAGDAFAAGYLSGLLFGLDQRSCLRRGHISAAATLTVHADRGPLPPAESIELLLAGSDDDWAGVRVAAGFLDLPGGKAS